MVRFKRFVIIVMATVFLLGTGSLLYAEDRLLRMATTTSTDNTGLLDYLAPRFMADTGIEWQWIAVGTGKALTLGKNCDIDVLLVHAPEAEKKYVEAGHGIDRRQVMYNDFVFIGPRSDPSGIKGKTVADALKTIVAAKGLFASRGDNSGTNKKEILLWKTLGIALPDKESWYIQTGQGMINTIVIAAERDAYTMTDRGTYIKYAASMGGTPPLVILVEGDPTLRNQYSVIAVNPKRCSSVKYDLAAKLSEWMASPGTQRLIGDFKLIGKRLFIPNADEK